MSLAIQYIPICAVAHTVVLDLYTDRALSVAVVCWAQMCVQCPVPVTSRYPECAQVFHGGLLDLDRVPPWACLLRYFL